jgi:hypothetical protein
MGEAAGGFVIGEAGPAAGDEGDVVSGGGHEFSEAKPDFFRRAAGERGHGRRSPSRW